jgi:tripartite-type tricarboxylate transporter receptor subunit TctC
VNDLISGVLQIGWTDPGTPVTMIEANKIKAIAISGSNRVPRTKTVATMGEQGYAFDSVGWFGVFGPANLPKPITARLNIEINKVQASAELAKRMETMNLEPPPVKTSEEFKSIIAADVKMWIAIAKESNITGE